jgi:hypothetical protein
MLPKSLGGKVKISELEDAHKLVTFDSLKLELRSFKSDLELARVERVNKRLNCAGLIGFGLVWGVIIGAILEHAILRK